MSAQRKALPLSLLVDEGTPSPSAALSQASSPTRADPLEAWFRDHFDTLWRLAARLGVPHANVDDVVQEVFITAERRLADIVPGSERRFLVSTTIKLSANARRRQETGRQRLAAFAHGAEPAADAEQLLAQKQLRQLLDVALDELPLEQRAVLVLHELEGFSVSEIADLLEVPQGTVASRLGRARAKFSKAAARLRCRWPGVAE